MKNLLMSLVLGVFVCCSAGFAFTEPVAHWKMDDASGYATDSSVNSYTGILEGYYGDAVFSTDAKFGTGSLLTVDNLSARMNAGKEVGSAASLTVSLWLKASKLDYSTVVSKMPLDDSGIGWAVMMRNDGQIWFRIGSLSDYNINARAAAGSYAAGQWVHVACTFTGGTAKIYVDGEPASTAENITQTINNTTADLCVGHALGEASSYTFDGVIDEVRLYDTALEQAEISDLADENFYLNENEAPDVSAGPGHTIWWPDNYVELNGSVIDDGEPNGITIASWTKEDGPGTVTFGDASIAVTDAVFSAPGTYTLRLTGDDTERYRYEDITVEVFTDGPNKPPLAYAGQDGQVWLPETDITLAGQVFDDGQTAGVTHTWSKVSGPGSVNFSDASALDTQATLSTPGDYVLKLFVSDGALTHEDTVNVEVVDPTSSTVDMNAWWKMDGDALDSSGNGYTGTLQNGAAFTTPGKVGTGALQCSTGTGSRLNCGTTAGASEAITVAMWAKPGSIHNGTIASKSSIGTSGLGWWIMMRNTGQIWFRIGSSANSNLDCTAPSAYTSGSWVHIAVTFKDGTARIYINGDLKDTAYGITQSVNDTTNPLYIGHTLGESYSYTYNGLVDEVAIYTDALSADNIADLYATGVKDYDNYRQRYDNNYGYTPQMFEDNFTYDLQVEYDLEGINNDAVKSPGPSYQHPRIFFNREDLPEIRNRIATTTAGAQNMYWMKRQVSENLTGDNGRWRDVYDDLAAGVSNSFYDIYIDDDNWTLARYIVEYMNKEAVRCLIEVDHDAAIKLAAAAETMTFVMQDQLNILNPTTSWQNVIQRYVIHNYTGILYDYIYPWMTDAQRSVMRNMLADATAGKWSIGMGALNASPAHTSNWFSWVTGDLLVETLAIEGEVGYDHQVYEQIVDAYRGFMTFGFYPESGGCFEPLGKNAMAAQNLLAISKRGDKLAACLAAKRHIDNYYLYSMMPWGGGWTMYDDWGGTNVAAKTSDVAVLKHVFPDNEVIDFVWRNALGEDYNANSNLDCAGYGEGTVDVMLTRAYDESKTWTQALSDATADKDLTFFCNDRGHVITRSSWDPNALQLHFKVGSVPGGHTHSDRGVFVLNALGRVWGDYPRSSQEQHSAYHSVVLVDSTGQGYFHCPPGKMIGFDDFEHATFGAGDLYWAYAKRFGGVQDAMDMSFNDFRLIKSNENWMDLDWYYLPDWYSNVVGNKQWADNMSLERAFRSAGIVRGDYPWAMVVDDIEKDNSTHSYKWMMRLPEDLLTSVSISGNDATLIDPDSNRRCLVRVLDVNGAGSFTIDSNTRTLRYICSTVTPEFKVMIYPYYLGDPVPATGWNGNNLTVAIGTQVDTVNFTVDADKRTRFDITRGGEVIFTDSCKVVQLDGDVSGDGNTDLEDLSDISEGWGHCYSLDELARLAEGWLGM